MIASFLVSFLVGRGLSEAIAGLVAKVVLYLLLVLVVLAILLTIRQHYVNEGWRNHAAAVAKQDDAAIAVNKKVEEQAQQCSDANGFWDVITQNCKLQSTEEKTK